MSKNNPNKRGEAVKKFFNGKLVRPVLYIGTRVGHGKYMAVQYEDGSMACDKSGKPVMWDTI